MKKICANPDCGQEFESKNQKRKYCCRKCFLDVHLIKPQECEYCKRVFTPVARGQRFCSNKCHFDLTRLPPKNCEQCGKEFSPKMARQKFCSPDCYYANLLGKHKVRCREHQEQHGCALNSRSGGGAKKTACICPRCRKKHKMDLWWVGKGTPLKYCQACRALVDQADPMVSRECGTGGQIWV